VSINTIALSLDGRHVEVWNNGSKIRTIAVEFQGLRDAVEHAKDYLLAWAGDEDPNIDPEVRKKMDEQGGR